MMFYNINLGGVLYNAKEMQCENIQALKEKYNYYLREFSEYILDDFT